MTRPTCIEMFIFFFQEIFNETLHFFKMKLNLGHTLLFYVLFIYYYGLCCCWVGNAVQAMFICIKGLGSRACADVSGKLHVQEMY